MFRGLGTVWLGKWQPISSVNKETDGKVSREASVNYMKDLRLEWAKPETRERFVYERTRTRFLLKRINSIQEEKHDDKLRDRLRKEVNDYLASLSPAEKAAASAVIEDIFSSARNTRGGYTRVSQGYFDILTLKEIHAETSNNLEVEKSKSEIKHLLIAGKWELLKDMADVLKASGKEAADVLVLLNQELQSLPESAEKQSLQDYILESFDELTRKKAQSEASPVPTGAANSCHMIFR